MTLVSLTEAAAANGMAATTLRGLCQQGRVEGAQRIGNRWAVPAGPLTVLPPSRPVGRPRKAAISAAGIEGRRGMTDEERDELLRGLAAKVDGLADEAATLRDEMRGMAVDVARLGEHYAKLTEQGWKHGERLNSIGAVLNSQSDRLERIEAWQNTHGERLERIEGRQATQGGQLGALMRDVDGLGGRMADHGERLDEIKASVDQVDGRVSDVARAVRELGGDVDEPSAEHAG